MAESRRKKSVCASGNVLSDFLTFFTWSLSFLFCASVTEYFPFISRFSCSKLLILWIIIVFFGVNTLVLHIFVKEKMRLENGYKTISHSVNKNKFFTLVILTKFAKV